MRPAALLVLAALGACASVPPPGVPLTGQWGGRHVGLELAANGGRLDYDCADGSIDAPLIPRRDGSFEVQGTHRPGHGGPEREGEVLPTYRVRFTGTVRGERMTMTGRLENGVLLGPFTLQRGAEPIIFRCL